LHGEYINKTHIILKLVNVMNTLLVYTLLGYVPENVACIGLYWGHRSGEIKQNMSDV